MIRSLLVSPLLASLGLGLLLLLFPAPLAAQEIDVANDPALPSLVAPAHVELNECEPARAVVVVLLLVRVGPNLEWTLAARPAALPISDPLPPARPEDRATARPAPTTGSRR